MEWQPRETAPTDGTEFLAYDSRTKRMDVCIAREIRPLGKHRIQIEQSQSDGEYGPGEDEFGYDGDDITHWALLPALPPPNPQLF